MPVDTVYVPRQEQVLFDSEIVEQAEVFRQYADPLLHLKRMLGNDESTDYCFSSRRRQQAGQHLYGGGFAGAVGAEECTNRACRYVEGEAVHRCKLTKAARQIAARDHG